MTNHETMKAIIIDDEEHARVTLSKLLEWHAPDVEILAMCSQVDAGIEAIREHNPDIVFLDIEMPVKNGFDLLQEIDEVNFEVVFVTAYDQFAVEAFKRHALAYLLKPVDEDELKVVIERARRQTSSPLNTQTIEQLFETLQVQQPGFNKIAFATMDGLEFVKADNIVRCSSDGNYTHVFRKDESPLLISKTLKDVEMQFSAYHQFVRVHHSHLVNMMFVKRYQKGKGGSLVMEDGSVIPVSRSRKQQLLSQF